jgi:hypothetical protein
MTIEYTWEFNEIAVKPQSDTLKDVIVSYEWKRCARDGSYYVYNFGNLILQEPDLSNFKNYDELTEQDLITWTLDKLTKTREGENWLEKCDTSLANQIDLMKNPPLVVKSAPWKISTSLSID